MSFLPNIYSNTKANNFNNIFENSNETNARAVYLTLSDLELHKRIEDRLASWLMIQPQFSEPLTARRYRVGEYHSPHVDYLQAAALGGMNNYVML